MAPDTHSSPDLILRDRRRYLDHVCAGGLDAAQRRRRPGAGKHYSPRAAWHGGWAIGLLVGINMLFGGTVIIGMALHARGVDMQPGARAS